jgi:transposase
MIRKLLNVIEEDAYLAVEEIKDLMKHTDNRHQHDRYQTIYLLLKGYNPKMVSEIISISLESVYNYADIYYRLGSEGLYLGNYKGANRRLTPSQEALLSDTVENKTPVDVGFPVQMNWTAALIRDWIKQEFDVNYSVGGVKDLLKRLNFTYTRPTYVLAKADVEKQEAFKEEFEEVKKRAALDENVVVLFEDESMIRDYQAIGATWFPKGKQKIIRTYGKHCGAKLIAVLDYVTGEVFCVQEEQYTAVEFKSFLEKVLEKYSDKKIIMILDNARIHHAKLLKQFLDSNKERLELKFLPPYSPTLNMIEELWGWLKSTVIYNVFFNNVIEIKSAVKGFIDFINLTPDVTRERLCLQY